MSFKGRDQPDICERLLAHSFGSLPSGGSVLLKNDQLPEIKILDHFSE